MFRNYFKTACRSLWKNKFYTLINISGLAVGLATGIMLLLWVQNEMSYDKFHDDHKQIFQLSSHFKSNEDDMVWEGVPGPLSVFARNIPQVESIVRINSQFDQVLANAQKDKIFDGNIVALADSGFFSMFSFPLVKGNKSTIFPNNNSIVVTQSIAEKLFGETDPLGKVVTFQKQHFTVTGVLRDFPENSSIRFDAILPMGFYAADFAANGGNGAWKTIDDDLGNYSFNAFVKLQPGSSPSKTEEAFTAAYKNARNGDSQTYFKLQSLGDVHLISPDGNNAALRMVQIFLLVVFLILTIASINYVNLSTARSLIRAKEVGIRKIIGARKRQLFYQFIIETLVLFCFATALAGGLIYVLMPLYNSISGKILSSQLRDMQVWKSAALAVAGTLIASGIYPALLLSSFRPMESLKGKVSSGFLIGSLRKVLVVFQFTISVTLIVCTIVMSSQINFIKSKDVGYDKSYVFTVPLTPEVVEHLNAVKGELKKQPGILDVATADVYDLSDINSSTTDIYWPGKPANSNMAITQVLIDEKFIETMKMNFVEGKGFSGMPSDSAHYVLNETAVKEMGLKPPYVGQKIRFHSWDGTIIGVVKDFNYQSLKKKIAPLLFFSTRWKPNILFVRTTPAQAQQSVAAVEEHYKKYAGGIPFAYNFLDKRFEAQYKSDARSGTLFNMFAGIAIFVSCLGLFGLATYMAQVRTKEIGIRKVLGATVSSIVQLMSKDFLKLVFIAILIAAPIAWWAMNKWLSGFAYRVDISWWAFALAGFVAFFIALVTVSFQAIKAAVAAPVDSLRTE